MKNLKITRRNFMNALTKCSCGAALAGGLKEGVIQCSNTRRQKPNIIFILADDLGYGDLGCYGQKQIQTPNIDQLASEGMKFSNHYAGSTVCAPSRCALMTGVHTGHTIVRGNKETKPMGQHPLPSDTTTVAKLLKERGYTTGLIGKWGLGGPGSVGVPNEQGFDTFFGYLCQRHAHNYYPEFLFRNKKRVPLKGNKVMQPRPDGAGMAIQRGQYSHDLCAEEALKFVEQNKERPFFLYLALTIPHANNEAGNKGMEVPDYGDYQDKNWPNAQKGHAAMITRLDRDVGRLISKLHHLNLHQKTLVIFTSDNGPHKEGGADPCYFNSNGPLRGIKRDLYEGGIRVPLIAWWPGSIKPGSKSGHISAFWDFLPTACDLAGAEVPANIDGISYAPTLTGGAQKHHKYLYWEFHERNATSQAIRMGYWKAVRSGPSSPIELFNIDKDINERDNLAGKNPDIVKEISALFDEARTESDIWELKG